MTTVAVGDAGSGRAGWLYLATMATVAAALLATFSTWGLYGRDHFAQIALAGDRSWYVNYDDTVSPEIQDRDILYHGIGSSIDNARKADVLILGHSSVLWALRDDMLERFGQAHHLRLFNMATAGDASGEFALRVIARNRLHPRLVIVNADDRTVNFFTPSIGSAAMFKESNAAEVVARSRWQSRRIVASRNLRWTAIDAVRAIETLIYGRSLVFPRAATRVWRSVERGDWNFRGVPAYWSEQNPPLAVVRSQDCPASPDEMANAETYVKRLGTTVVLMLIPTPEFCPQRVRDIAARLGLETIIPDFTAYTNVDRVHYDYRGATLFTAFFLERLTGLARARGLLHDGEAGHDE